MAVGAVAQRNRVDIRCPVLLQIWQADLLAVLDALLLARVERLHVGEVDLEVLGPDDLAVAAVNNKGVLHGDDGLVAADLHDDGALVEAEGHDVGVLLGDVDGPRALHRVAQRDLELVGLRVPHFHVAVLGGRDDEGQLGVEDHGGDVFCVAVEGVDALFGLVVPDFHEAVVAAGDYVGFVAFVVVQTIDPVLVAFEREVRRVALGLHVPNLGLIEKGLL